MSAQDAAPQIAAVPIIHCKYQDAQAGTDYVGFILGGPCGPPTAVGQVDYTTCGGARLLVDRAKLKASEVGCSGGVPVDVSRLAVLAKVQTVSSDGQSVVLSYTTKEGLFARLTVPSSFIGSNVTVGKDIVVFPTVGGDSKKTVTDKFLQFRNLIDKGAFADGEKTGLQLQLKQ